MMLKPVSTNQFKRDVKKAKKQGKDCSKLKKVTDRLIEDRPLAARYKDHSLTRNYRGYRECHIEPDWLLIYAVVEDKIFFERLGSHSELFR
ncbi:type II toxin-antitoxin system YafQ family toxin [Endozoicomonas sp. ALB032]|uniref:type II toxin-antitoxin system YafQ family toxin n=1 Tax=Endozoicomonas sp. ALB032 TaxID=3403082 RepID=UPI003BB7F513